VKTKFKSWIIESRAPFLTGTLVSIFLGTAIAWARNNIFNFDYFLLALLGGIFLHLGANIANDYFDHKSGNDEVNKEFIRPFSGGSRTIQLGLLSPREVLAGALLFYAAAILIGVYFALAVGLFIVIIGLFGVFSGFFYTAPSLNWAGRGVGEILVGINFGALMTLGAYYVQTGSLALEPIVASAPISFLIAAILFINQFPDYTADKAVGKNNWVVRLGKAKAAYVYGAIVLGAYISLFLSVALRVSPPQVLFALIPLPLAIAGIRFTFKFHSEASHKLAPANALTIAFHFLTSLLISCGYLLYEFEVMSLAYFSIVAIVGACVFLTIHLYMTTKKPSPQLL
jgi:1,4-dihydroxy-2-naphthoate octaprenyltransferase